MGNTKGTYFFSNSSFYLKALTKHIMICLVIPEQQVLNIIKMLFQVVNRDVWVIVSQVRSLAVDPVKAVCTM